MAGTKEIKRRIKSVKNTKKITKAMELVAASKMKRAVSSTLSSRAYALYSWEILSSIAKNGEEIDHPFFKEKKEEELTGKTLLLLISSNRGLCGAYNAQIIKKTISFIKKSAQKIDVITLGKRGDVAMRRLNQNVVANFFETLNDISLRNITPISEMVMNEFMTGKYDRVLIGYTDFVSALTQRPNIKQVLPVSKTELKEFIENLGEQGENSAKMGDGEQKTEYLFEGVRDKLIASLALKLTKMQIYQMILESNASEESARMMAMKNASDASGEMIDDLTLAFNKARQANITREISEISAGMASVS
ncbi:MAG: ATP synthase F1 subunit gamma [Minisyncoccia bacterium]